MRKEDRSIEHRAAVAASIPSPPWTWNIYNKRGKKKFEKKKFIIPLWETDRSSYIYNKYKKIFRGKKKDNGLELKFNVAILQYVCLSDHAAFYVGV